MLRALSSPAALASVVILVWLVPSAPSQQAPPSWWASRGVLSSGVPADDFAVANVGQLKHVATKAAAEMDAVLPGGAGPQVRALLAAWAAPGTGRDDYAALTVGQLKSVAALFHQRLATLRGTAVSYPWGGTGAPPADDFALANVGQIKAVFAFAITAVRSPTSPQIPSLTDTDGDGLSDAFEWLIISANPNDGITGLSHVSPSGDFDGDHITNLMEFIIGTDPIHVDNPYRSVAIPVPFDGADMDKAIGTLNALGEFVAVNPSTGLVRVGRPAPGGNQVQWSDLANLGSTIRYTMAKQNNRGLRIVWNPDSRFCKLIGPTGGVAHLDLPIGAYGISIRRVTDSGFVYGNFRFRAPVTLYERSSAFRYRNGRLDLFGETQGVLWGTVSSASERGEMVIFTGTPTYRLSIGGLLSPLRTGSLVLQPNGGWITAPFSLQEDITPWNPYQGSNTILVNNSGHLVTRGVFYDDGAPLPILLPPGNGETEPTEGTVTFLNRLGEVGGNAGDRAFIWSDNELHLPTGTATKLLASNDIGWHAFSNTYPVDIPVYDSDGNFVETTTVSRTSYSLLIRRVEPASNANLLPDLWEIEHFGAPGQNPDADPDQDGLSNWQEYALGTIPRLADPDGDSFDDRTEVDAGMDPLRWDAGEDVDGDGLPWTAEFAQGTSPYHCDLDSDGDGVTDSDELQLGTNPNLPDSDGDGIPDFWGSIQAPSFGHSIPKLPNFKLPTTTIAHLTDADHDGILDHWEAQKGTNPLIDDTLVDLDADAYRNVAEYLLGLNPLGPEPARSGALPPSLWISAPSRP